METSPNLSKHGKGVNRSESQTPEEAGLVDDLCISDLNDNWGAEPNFNLNLNLTSPSNPRPPTEALKLHGGTTKDEGNTGGGKSVNKEIGKWASTVKTALSQGEEDDSTRQKSRLPALCRSPTAETSVNRRGEQRLKSPNSKDTPTLPPKTHTQSPQPHQHIVSGPTTAERLKTHRADSAIVLSPKLHTAQPNETTAKSTNKVTGQKIKSNRKEDGWREGSLKTQSPQTLHVPVNPNTRSQKGNTTITSPKPTSRTPTLAGKTQKPDLATTTVKANEQATRGARTHCETSSISPKLQNQRVEMTLLSTKTPQQSSLSPKLTTQKNITVTKNSDMPDSKENLHSKNSSAGSLSKSSRSSSKSKATTVTMDSLDCHSGNKLKAIPHSKTTVGSRDSLDSKSGSTSKTSWSSKDSLDSKTGSNSKASSYSKTGMGSRDSLDSKTTTEIKLNKDGLDSKTAVTSKSALRSKDDPDPPLVSVTPDSESNFSSSSDIHSSSITDPVQLTSQPTLTGSGSDKNCDLSTFLSSSGPNNNNLNPNTTTETDSYKSGPIQSSSKSALPDLPSSLALSPSPESAIRSPGPGKNLGSVPFGPSGESLRSPSSVPGNYLKAVLR